MKPAEIIMIQFKKLDNSYYKVVPGFKKKQVHQYRLRVKKLRAFISLLKHAATQPHKLKLSAKLEELFHLTGAIRNLQLQKQRILGFSFKAGEISPISYLNFLAEEEQQWKDEARRLGHASILKKGKKLLRYTPGHLSRIQVKKFLGEETGTMHGLIALPQLRDEDLHQLRKIVKGMLYNWCYVGTYAVPVLPFCFENKKKIEFMTVALGNFQDLCIALQLLDAFSGEGIAGESEMQTLANIKVQWEADKNNMKAELKTMIAAIKTGTRGPDFFLH
jgi:CHAD domain-containing protein